MKKTALAYGSLLNKESREKTLRNAGNIRKVNVYGYKRCFEILSAKREEANDKRALLTIKPDKSAVFNAVVIDVTDEEDWRRLLAREAAYIPRLITCYDFDTGEEIKHVTAFIGFPDRIFPNLPANEEYMELCRKGAYSFGEEFGRRFDETTFMGDGKVLSEYLRK